MENEEKKDAIISITLPETSIANLRGRQSVRTTFKLSAKTISAVSIVATQLGIKQKSLFDHLIEDIQSLSSIADKIRHLEFKKSEGVQKTYVISRKSLLCLDQMSKSYQMPRDALVEYSVERLLPIIAMEREKHKNRKKISKDIKQYLEAGRAILDESKQILGEDDPVFLKLKMVMNVAENNYREIELFIDRGSIIEDF